MKKLLILSAACAFLILSGACFTPLVYKDKTHSFMEKISSFLITEDGKQLMVIGQRYHYLFTANETLKLISRWDKRKEVKASFSRFVVNKDQLLSGTYTLAIHHPELLPKEIQLLKANGFTSQGGTPELFIYQGQLSGRRYTANGLNIPPTMKLTKIYEIHMVEEEPLDASEVAKRILLTPLAVTADGLLILGGAPILLFSVMFD